MTTKEVLETLHTEVYGTEEDYYDDDELQQFAEHYINSGCDDDVVEAFLDYWWDTKPCRRCSACGQLMREGYCDCAGYAYYCSDECLRTHYTAEAWEAECEEDDQSYYTQWY